MFDTVSEVPRRAVAIVLGARVFSDGSPSAVLRDRLDTALELYRARKVSRILVSGDHRTDAYDEVNAMHRYLLARGVPEPDVFLDHAGLRTFDTMHRARAVFEIDEAVVCTQEFHLYRAVFLARRQGIDAVGVKADRRRYESHRYNEARELLARTRAFIDVFVLDARARHLGDPLPIVGDARLTHDRRPPR